MDTPLCKNSHSSSSPLLIKPCTGSLSTEDTAVLSSKQRVEITSVHAGNLLYHLVLPFSSCSLFFFLAGFLLAYIPSFSPPFSSFLSSFLFLSPFFSFLFLCLLFRHFLFISCLALPSLASPSPLLLYFCFSFPLYQNVF